MTPKKKPTLPSSVRIGAHDYAVAYDEQVGVMGAMGITSEENARIHIDDHLNDGMQKETLVHEMLHAAWFQSSLRVRVPASAPDSDGEKIIQDLSPIIFSFIKDNPEAIEWLQSESSQSI